MYVYFEMDEPTLLRTRKAVNEGKIKLPDKGSKIPVSWRLQGEDGFPHQGTINFVNNQVNPTTGSILVRGVFPNPLPKAGRPAVIAGHVRENPAADRPASSGAAGGRSSGRIGPGPQISCTSSMRKTRLSIAG